MYKREFIVEWNETRERYGVYDNIVFWGADKKMNIEGVKFVVEKTVQNFNIDKIELLCWLANADVKDEIRKWARRAAKLNK